MKQRIRTCPASHRIFDILLLGQHTGNSSFDGTFQKLPMSIRDIYDKKVIGRNTENMYNDIITVYVFFCIVHF